MRGLPLFLLVPLGLGLSGCLARTALDVATAPLKVVRKAADLATTSQSEADERRGREIRRREERLGTLQREREKLEKQCIGGVSRACSDLARVTGEMELLLPQLPYEREPIPKRR